MKYIIVSIVLFFSVLSGFGQSDDAPVLWSQEIHQISDTAYELVMKAKIADEWHVFSQFTPEGGSIPSQFTYKNVGADFELIGNTSESETTSKYEEVFEIEEVFFIQEAIFKQKIKLLNSDVQQIDINLFYQVCKEVCITVEKDFNFRLDGGEAVVVNQSVDDRSLALTKALKKDLKNMWKYLAHTYNNIRSYNINQSIVSYNMP